MNTIIITKMSFILNTLKDSQVLFKKIVCHICAKSASEMKEVL